MKWVTYNKDKEQAVGILNDEGIISLKSMGFDFNDVNDVIQLNKNDYCCLLDKISAYTGELIKFEEVKIVAPILNPLQDVLCVGLNYSEHCKEANQYEKDTFTLAPKHTVYFSKRVNQTSSYQDEISSHQELTNKFDYETEVAVVLKEDCKNCSKEEIKDKIFGYVVINDYSARDLQTNHQQWYIGKSLDGCFAMGQYILTADECPSLDDLEVKTTVNGELRQNSSTKNMMKSIEEIIVELSKYMTLKKGTIIATGTPSGVGMGFNPPKFLKAGDVVISEVENLGYIRNVIV